MELGAFSISLAVKDIEASLRILIEWTHESMAHHGARRNSLRRGRMARQCAPSPCDLVAAGEEAQVTVGIVPPTCASSRTPRETLATESCA